MATVIRESVVLKQEKWRVFELLKKIDRFPEFVPGIERIRKGRLAFGGFSEWNIKYGGLDISWKQEELFCDSDFSLVFKMVDGDFKYFEGRCELNGADVNRGTQIDLALSIDWKQDYLDRDNRESLDRKARLAVRSLLRQIQRNTNRGVLKQILEEIGLNHLQTFFGVPLPDHVKDNFKNEHILAKLNQQQIMETINFSPPFLKIQKMIIVSRDAQNVLKSKSLGMGVITQADTEGHYNGTIFLALCGQLMASAASVHLASLFPKSAPQVIEANGVKPLVFTSKWGKLLKPSKQGTPFFVEASIVKKKMQLVFVTSKISFDSIQYGVIEGLTLALSPVSSLSLATEIPPR